MHALGIQPLTICQAKQGLNDVFSDLRSARIAGDAKLVSTGGDIYIEAAFDLAYVLIKLSIWRMCSSNCPQRLARRLLSAGSRTRSWDTVTAFKA
jgi:hypothetical protein